MPIEPIDTPHAPISLGHYSPAVRAGDWIILSGQIGIDPSTGALIQGGYLSETRQALNNIEQILNDCGASKADIAKVTLYIAEMRYLISVNEIYSEFFGEHRPARTTIGPATLPAGAIVEVDIWAYKPK